MWAAPFLPVSLSRGNKSMPRMFQQCGRFRNLRGNIIRNSFEVMLEICVIIAWNGSLPRTLIWVFICHSKSLRPEREMLEIFCRFLPSRSLPRNWVWMRELHYLKYSHNFSRSLRRNAQVFPRIKYRCPTCHDIKSSSTSRQKFCVLIIISGCWPASVSLRKDLTKNEENLLHFWWNWILFVQHINA